METFDGNIQINHYDAEGLQTEMEENGRLAAFIFNPAKEVVTETEDRTVLRYIQGSELIARNTDAVRTYYHYASDEMGSITHVTDEEGNLLNRYEYDAWGNLTAEEEQVSNRFKYMGEQFDAITQQYYLRARFYNPSLARFMQEDTYRGDGLNLYAYCANNPVRYVDPSGHQCDKKNNSQNQSDAYDINNTGSGMNTNGKEIPLLPEPVITGQNRLPGPVADGPNGGRCGDGGNTTKYVSWMNEDAYNRFYANNQNATLGAPNGAVWVMRDVDAAMCTSIGAVARDTGMAGGVKSAYLNGDTYVYGLVVDSNSVSVSKPTSLTPGVNADWNSNGKTAVNGEGFVLDTGVEEFVINGGNEMPKGSYSFRMDDYGNIEVLKEWD